MMTTATSPIEVSAVRKSVVLNSIERTESSHAGGRPATGTEEPMNRTTPGRIGTTPLSVQGASCEERELELTVRTGRVEQTNASMEDEAAHYDAFVCTTKPECPMAAGSDAWCDNSHDGTRMTATTAQPHCQPADGVTSHGQRKADSVSN